MAVKNNRKQYLTLRDVAREAGVSAITASRALRTPHIVSPDTRAKVKAAVETLGYVPNPAAQALASSRSRMIGVIIPSVTNQIFADFMAGVMDSAEGGPYEPQFANTRYRSHREVELLRLFNTQRPAGMIVTGIDQSPDARRIIEQMDCPVVQVLEVGSDPIDMMIGCDQTEAGRCAVRHLIEQGYRRIGFLGARMDPRAQRRLAGYRDVLAVAGLGSPSLIVTTPQASSASLGGRLMSDLLATAPDVDAVFCNNDDVALGALFECQRRGIKVPTQMGIVGFNDLDVVSVSVPSITSVRIDRYGMGVEAVRMLRAAIAGRRPEPAVINQGFSLMIRQSTQRREAQGV
jgi:LacI family transcriptional regulator, gluconate utilization system Gnt-I transcriptional repressor